MTDSNHQEPKDLSKKGEKSLQDLITQRDNLYQKEKEILSQIDQLARNVYDREREIYEPELKVVSLVQGAGFTGLGCTNCSVFFLLFFIGFAVSGKVLNSETGEIFGLKQIVLVILFLLVPSLLVARRNHKIEVQFFQNKYQKELEKNEELKTWVAQQKEGILEVQEGYRLLKNQLEILEEKINSKR